MDATLRKHLRLSIANLAFCFRPLVFSLAYHQTCHGRSELIDNRQLAIGNHRIGAFPET